MGLKWRCTSLGPRAGVILDLGFVGLERPRGILAAIHLWYAYWYDLDLVIVGNASNLCARAWGEEGFRRHAEGCGFVRNSADTFQARVCKLLQESEI